MAKNSFKRAISLANSGQRFPVLSLVRTDPGLAATISKLIVDNVNPPQYGHDGNRQAPMPDFSSLKNQSENLARSKADAQTVMQLLPDMELAAQILISSIIAPKDMTTTELTFSHAEGLLPPEVSAALIGRVKQHFEQDYKIEPLLPKMLRDILFEAGSYPIAVIPENSIDEAINSQTKITLESLASDINKDGSIKSLGLLGPAVKNQPTSERLKPGLSLEAFEEFKPRPDMAETQIKFELSLPRPVSDSYVSVTDNPNLLKIPQIHQKIREERIKQTVGSKAMESLGNKLTDRELSSLVYKDRQFAYKPISTLKTQEQLNRRTIGNPLVLHLPSESVIPVHVPGTPEEQVGFFVLIDADGNPVSKATNVDYYQELQSRLNQNGSFPSAMLTKVKGMMEGFDLRRPDHLDYSARAYGQMVEQDLLARLRNGVYGNGVAIAKKEEVWRIMLARALAKQHTQLLFLPIELMTYFAFRFNEDGTGKSLLDDMQILNSLRSMLMFSNVMASVRNSIGRTNVALKLDENDPDPKKAIEIAMHEIVRSRQQAFPLGTNSPTDLVDWLQRASLEFTFEGHPGLPDMSIEFTEKNSNYVKPDQDLEEGLRKRAIMATGLSPEMVDNSFNAEFATTALQNNLLLSKRVTQVQEQFTPQLSDHMRKVMMNSENLIEELRDIIDTNFDKLKVEEKTQEDADEAATTTPTEKAQNQLPGKKPDDKDAGKKADESVKKVDEKLAREYIITQFLNEFIMSFEVMLPRPNSVTLENQLTALETYKKALDETLDAYLNTNFFTSETGGDVSGQVDAVKEMLKAYFIRQWLSENGVMTELAAITTTDAEGKPTLDLFGAQKSHVENLTKSLTSLMVGLQEVKNASDTVLQNKVGEMEAAPTPSSDDTGSDTGGGDDFGLGGGDDMNFDMDLPGGDDPTAGGDGATTDDAGAGAPEGGDAAGGESTEQKEDKPEGGDQPTE